MPSKIKNNKKTIVLSLGGSLIAPSDVDTKFLINFRKEILKFVKRGNKVIIVCGGGGLNKKYNNSAKEITKLENNDLDWIGIMATRLNAEIVRAIFGKAAHSNVIIDPSKKFKTDKKIIIAAGWKPGWSTDYDAVMLADMFKAKDVYNLTNISHVYSKDPRKFNDAKKYESLSWKEYLGIVGEKWTPRMNAPFDPIAAKLAMRKGISVSVAKGDEFENIKNILNGKKVDGTLIK